MANQTVYPYGTNGTLPSSVGIINDLTTGGSDKALSAEQGKVIGNRLDNARVVEIDTKGIQSAGMSLAGSKKWGGTKAAQQHIVIPCSAGDQFSIEPVPEGTNTGNWYGWLTSAYTPPTGIGTTPYATGCDRVWLNVTEAPTIVTAPSDAAYLCLVLSNGATAAADRTCTWKVYKVEALEDALKHDITRDGLEEVLTYDGGREQYEKVGHFSLAADPTTYSSLSIGELIPGETYKLVFDDFSWVDRSVSGYKFNIYYYEHNASSATQLFFYYNQDRLPKEFVFVAEDGARYYGYGGRGITGSSIGLTLYRLIKKPETGEVTEDTLRLIRQAKFNGNNPVFGLLHYSDIHGDAVAARHILTAVDNLDGYVDDVISTGDSVYYYSSDQPWWASCGLPEKSLFVVGNHDGRVSSNLDGEGKAWVFDHFFAPYIEGLDYDMPEGYDDSSSINYQACYWSKDYPAAKIRLIGVDGVHRFYGTVDPETGEILESGFGSYSNEQELWLISKLNETLDSENDAYGYSVVIAGHYCLDPYSGDNNITNTSETGGRVVDYKTTGHTNFHLESAVSYSINGTKFDYKSYTSTGSAKQNNNFAEIVMNWKNKGGKFIAWICGHMHYDLFYYPTNYPDLLCVSINQAGWRRESGFENRYSAKDGRTCANYYAIDTNRGLFKIIRIGTHNDIFLIPKYYLCYDYINKKVISEG